MKSPLAALRKTARAFARQLEAEGHRSIAVTGSVARQDAADGADIDFWVVSPTDRVEQHLFENVPVTVMFFTEEKLNEFTQLCMMEMDDAWVVLDRDRVWSRLKARFRRLKPAIREAITDDTVLDVFSFLRNAQRGSLHWRMWNLQEAMVCLASLEVYRQTGWRAAKLKHVKAVVTATQWKRFCEVLLLQGSAARNASMQPRLERALDSSFILQQLPALIDSQLGSEGTQAPLGTIATLEHGHRLEGLVGLRRYFDEACLSKCPPTPAGDPLDSLSAPLRDYWFDIHGISRTHVAQVTSWKRQVEHFRDYLKACRIKNLLQPTQFLR